MNRRGFISLLAGSAGAVFVPWRGNVERIISLSPAWHLVEITGMQIRELGVPSDWPDTLAHLFDCTMQKAVTSRTYGDRGQHKRPMFHRWPCAKVRGSVPMSQVMILNIYDSSPLMRALVQRGRHR